KYIVKLNQHNYNRYTTCTKLYRGTICNKCNRCSCHRVKSKCHHKWPCYSSWCTKSSSSFYNGTKQKCHNNNLNTHICRNITESLINTITAPVFCNVLSNTIAPNKINKIVNALWIPSNIEADMVRTFMSQTKNARIITIIAL